MRAPGEKGRQCILAWKGPVQWAGAAGLPRTGPEPRGELSVAPRSIWGAVMNLTHQAGPPRAAT